MHWRGRKVYRKIIYDWKLRRKLFLSHGLVILISIVLMALLVGEIVGSYILRYEEKNHIKNIEVINQTMDYNFNLYRSKGDIIFSNLKLQQTLGEQYEDLPQIIGAHRYINDLLHSTMADFDNYLSKYRKVNQSNRSVIYTSNASLREDGHYLISIEKVYNQPWYEGVVKDGVHNWVVEKSLDTGRLILKLRRRLMDVNESTFLGIWELSVPVQAIDSLLTINYTMDKDESLIYIDENNQIIVCQGAFEQSVLQGLINQHLDSETQVKKFKWNNETYLMAQVPSEETDYHLVSIVALKDLKEGYKNITKVTIVVIIVSTAVCLLVSLIMAYALSSRLTKLTHDIKEVQSKQQEPLLDIYGEDEIGQLATVFNKMIIRIRHYVFNEYKNKMIQEQTKLELLQEQINPHLLYNTLSFISWQAKEAGQQEIYHIAKSLIRFYRTTLNRGEIIVQFNQELQMAREYIEILEYTYEIQLEKEVQFQEAINEFYGIKLILQPIIENAIMHGLRNSRRGKKLSIIGEIQDEWITFTIEDNGCGMDRDTVQGLLEGNEEKGYGLTNVIKRIRLYYKDKQHIGIESEPGGGTKIIIKIPALSKKQLKDHIQEVRD